MKIAFSTSGADLSAPLDTRFGRAARFLIFDSDDSTFTVVANEQNLNAIQGAGIQAAQTLVNHDINALVSGHCGPKAFRVLSSAGVAVYTCNAATVREALELFNAKQLTRLDAADVAGHWS